MTHPARRLPAVLWLGIMLASLGPVSGARGQGTPVDHAAVDLVDVHMYRYFMEDRLYAHDGDNRGFGPEHDLCRDEIESLFAHYGLDVTLHPFQWSGNTDYNVKRHPLLRT